MNFSLVRGIDQNAKERIVKEVKAKFGVDIGVDIVEFLQAFQNKVAIEEGFAKRKSVLYYNLATFKYNEKKVDSKNVIHRLLNKHGNDSEKALAEFKALGKELSIYEKGLRDAERENKEPPAPRETRRSRPVLKTNFFNLP